MGLISVIFVAYRTNTVIENEIFKQTLQVPIERLDYKVEKTQ